MARAEIAKFKMERPGRSIFRHIPYLTETDIGKLKAEYERETDIKKKICLGYLYEQRKCFGLDYDDLLTVALHILENHEEKRKKWQERMMYVMVDEFQDVSELNYELADILSGYHKNLFIVGDPDQTIYSWRGAKVGYILDFDKFHAKTTALEGEWITEQIEKLLEAGRKYSDIAILYRAHFVSRSIEEAFIKKKIPYILYSGIEFYKRKENKDILSYMRMVLYGDDLFFCG